MASTFIIRCRAIILHEGKLLLVRHPHDTSFAALPGGHLEWGENPEACISREIVEELGVKPEIGRLLYVNTFEDEDGAQPVEFFFEIMNGSDYVDCETRSRTHAHELAEIKWTSPTDDVRIRPEQLGDDFRRGDLISDRTRFIGGIMK